MCECIGRNTTTAPWFIDGLMCRKSERNGTVLLLLLLLSSLEAAVVVRSRSSSRSDRMRQKRVLAGRFRQRRHCSRVQKQIHHRCDRGGGGRGGRRGELVYKQRKGKGKGNRPASSTWGGGGGRGYLTLSLAATAGHTPLLVDTSGHTLSLVATSGRPLSLVGAGGANLTFSHILGRLSSNRKLKLKSNRPFIYATSDGPHAPKCRAGRGGGGGGGKHPKQPPPPPGSPNILCVILLPNFWIGTNYSFHPMD
jgi:hypothetical protein